jgi:hypothetical protein
MGTAAHADGLLRLSDGAPIYAATRPLALVGAMQKLGVSDLPAIKEFRKQLGGIDPFNPIVLAAPGIDVAAPLVASFSEQAGGGQLHHRVVAAIRDKGLFSTFVQGLIAGGQLKLATAPATLKDAIAVSAPAAAGERTVLLRTVGDEAVLDVVEPPAGKKAPAPAELARRYPLAPVKSASFARGARRLFAPDATVVLYFDGRHMGPVLQKLAEEDLERDAKSGTASERAKARAKLRAQATRCAGWLKAPGLFDDAALALTATPDALTLTWAWGTASGPPLGGLKLAASDDAALDVRALAREATGVVALYAATLAPFGTLKRSGYFASAAALNDAVDGCETQAGVHLILRSWPLALGAITAAPSQANSPMAMVQQGLGSLRNVVVAMRDFTPAGAHFAVAASFDAAARSTFEMLLAGVGASGSATSIGKRSATVYSLQIPGMPKSAAAALESLQGNRVAFTLADSDESLNWAYKAATKPAGGVEMLPLLRLDADTVALQKLGGAMGAGPELQQALDLLAKLRHVDGALVTDGDLLRLSLHAPLRSLPQQ